MQILTFTMFNPERLLTHSCACDAAGMSAADRPGDAFVTYEGMHRMSQYTLYLILFHDSVDKWIETEKQLVSSDVDDSDIYA